MQYVDCSNYLDVRVHTEPVELHYNNNSNNNVSQDAEVAKPMPVKRGRPPTKKYQSINFAKSANETLPAALGKYRADALEAVRTPTLSTNGDITSHGSIDGAMEADGGSSAIDFADDEQDEMMWPNFGQNDEDADVDDDFDNQLLITPVAAPTAQLDMDGNGVRPMRRQIRGPAYCALCNKTFQYYSLYRNHMTKHSNETPFKCVMCKKGFKSKQAIRYHMHTHQKEKRHKCPLCHAAYYTENQVITHLLTHENESIFPCMVCGKILRSDRERDLHLATHTEERPFRCEYCNKLFRLRHHLSNHLKIHRQYRCDFCRADFTSAVHQRKPYACVACAKHSDVQHQMQQAQSEPPAELPTAIASEETKLNRTAELNPLQLFEVVAPPKQPIACVDLAEMVSEQSSSNSSSSSSSSSSSTSTSGTTSEIDTNNLDDDMQVIDDDDDDEESLKAQNSAERTYAWQLESTPGFGNKNRWHCKYCMRTYSSVNTLKNHIRNKHP